MRHLPPRPARARRPGRAPSFHTGDVQAMLDIKTVGLLLRENSQDIPLARMEALFARLGVQMHVLNHHKPNEKLDLLIAMGGDGTVLKALDLQPDCPVLAINYGTVGFLTAGDRTDLERLLVRLLANDYILSERLLLHCTFPWGTAHAVNEVLVRSFVRMISVEVYVNEAKIRTIRGDGVIVGTPTGSTGFLLSTGAPLVMPGVDCLILDGLLEYNFTSRALILAPDSRIRLHVPSLPPEQRATVVVDGNELGQLGEGEEIIITRSERRAQLIFFEENYFFRNLASRLSWL